MIVQMDAVECKKAGSDSLLAARTYVPTANPRRLTATANRLILAPDERSLQVDLVRLDRTVPVPGCIGSRDSLSFDTNPTCCGATPRSDWPSATLGG